MNRGSMPYCRRRFSTARAVIFLMALTCALLAPLGMQSAQAATSLSAGVNSDTVIISLNNLGERGGGTAEIRCFSSNEYPSGDSTRGVVSKTSSGTLIGTYACGTRAQITTARFNGAGADLLYSKFYVILGKRILAGPVYATATPGSADVTVKTTSKKGVFSEDTAASLETMRDLGAQHTTVNIDLNNLLLPNETATGKSIDNTKGSAVAFKSNGKTYYFNKKTLDAYDNNVRSFSAAGLEISAIIVLSPSTNNFATSPRKLTYTNNCVRLHGFNTSNNLGRDYWIAAMEFLAQRYSGEQELGTISNFIIGNEIDQTFNYFKMSENVDGVERVEKLSTLVEEYGRCVRLANNAVKKYTSNGKVSISITHFWTGTAYNSQLFCNTWRRANSYRPKDIVDLFASRAAACGDYDWGISQHSYCVSLPDNDVGYQDTGMNPRYRGWEISGDMNSTNFITVLNTEVLEQYLEQPRLRFNGQLRQVYLTETGVSSHGNTKVEYETQAAYIAQYYYRVANLDCVHAINYYRLRDHATEGRNVCFGLMDVNGKKKDAYEVYKWIDTEQSFTKSDPYLKRIQFKKNGVVHSVAKGNIHTWQDVMDVVDVPGWDWSLAWKTSNIIASSMEETSQGEGSATSPHQWKLVAQTKAPTCTSQGKGTFTCSDCGKSETHAIASLGHKWDSYVTVSKTKHTHAEQCSRCKTRSWTFACSFNKTLVKKTTKKTNARYKYACILCGHSYTTGAGGTVGKKYKVGGSTFQVTSNSNVALIKAPNAKTVAVKSAITIGGISYSVNKIGKGAFVGSKIRTVKIGANVSKLATSTFKGSRVTSIVMQSKKLTKAKAVRGALKGTRSSTVKIKVSVGTAKENKSYLKKYKKIFTKKNCGATVKLLR